MRIISFHFSLKELDGACFFASPEVGNTPTLSFSCQCQATRLSLQRGRHSS